MQVVASAVGYDGLTVRTPGEEFAAPLGLPDENGKRHPIAKASWYKEVVRAELPKEVSKGKGGKDDSLV